MPADRSRRLIARAAALASLVLTAQAALAVDPPVKDAPAPVRAVAAEDLERLGPGPSSLTLDRVVVTPGRGSSVNLQTPYATDVVSGSTIEQKNFRTVPEALQEIPGVLVQKTSHGQGSPFIRGFTGFRTLFLIDGIRLNNSTFREGPNQYWATVDPLSLDRLEVVKGPASALYGSDAIGGTVNAITKDPWTYGSGWQHGGNLYLRGASAERSFAAHPELSLTNGDKLGVIVSGSYKDFGDLQGGRDTGRQDNTAYDEGGIDFKLEYFFNPDTKLVVANQYYRQNNVPRTHSTIFAEPFEGSAVGTDRRRDLDQERMLTYAQLHAENVKGTFFDSFHGSVSWHRQYEGEDRIRGNGNRSVDEVNVGTLGVSAQFTSNTAIGKLTYGVEYYRDNVSSRSTSNTIQGPVADDATYDLLGVFVQDEITLAPQWRLTLGGRYTYARVDAGSVLDTTTGDPISIEDDWSALVGNARLTYLADPKHWSVYTGVAQGFRAPNLSDLSRLDIARSGEQEVPTPGLDPEYYTSFELGTKYENPQFSLQAAYFYTLISDQIVRRPTDLTNDDGNTIVVKENAGDGYVQGIELGMAWRFHPDWTAFGTVAWQDGEIDGFPTSADLKRKEPVSRLLPITALLGLRYEPSRKLFVEATILHAHAQDDLSSGDQRDTQRIPPGGTPSYTTLNLRAGYRVNRNFAINAGIENLLDEDYRTHGSGTNSAGRNFLLSMTFSY
ncbi:MAG TPA: TonB-dependent receptor [Tepidisphaeraceae bacterium]|nr:TonB-dependent receptor [Tepidisphaeraceae bacterium]